MQSKPRKRTRRSGADVTPLARNTKNDATRGVGARIYADTTTAAAAARTSPDKPLTEKQRRFALAIAEGDSEIIACRRAGYADNSYAPRLMAMPAIQRLIARERAAFERDTGMTRQKVLEMFQEAFADAKMLSEPSSMVAAAREIGKMCGYYAPVEQKVSVSVSGQIAMERMDRLSDEELLRLITQGSQLGAPADDDEGEGDDIDGPPALPPPADEGEPA